MCYKKFYDVDKVGVHPSNREWQGLVLSDVASLTSIIGADGFRKDLCNAAAGECPRNEEGDGWREFNHKLWCDSGGILPITEAAALEIVTITAGHTTASIKCMKHGARSDDEILAPQGTLQLGTILDRNPTLREPIEKGIEYCQAQNR